VGAFSGGSWWPEQACGVTGGGTRVLGDGNHRDSRLKLLPALSGWPESAPVVAADGGRCGGSWWPVAVVMGSGGDAFAVIATHGLTRSNPVKAGQTRVKVGIGLGEGITRLCRLLMLFCGLIIEERVYSY
jgi:hypothetical protein